MVTQNNSILEQLLLSFAYPATQNVLIILSKTSTANLGLLKYFSISPFQLSNMRGSLHLTCSCKKHLYGTTQTLNKTIPACSVCQFEIDLFIDLYWYTMLSLCVFEV